MIGIIATAKSYVYVVEDTLSFIYRVNQHI